jgi:hypothetical protein
VIEMTDERCLQSYDVRELVDLAPVGDGSLKVVPRPLLPPNAWWAEFDRALAFALSWGRSPLAAEEFAIDAAESRYPGQRNA